jgi:elongation factor Tu
MEIIFGKKTVATPPPPVTAARGSGGPFEFEVEDVFTITGRGTVATGRITKGRIAVGDEIVFKSPKGDLVQRRIAAIEAFRKIIQEASEGETVGLLLAKPVPFDVLVRGVRFERA